MYRRRRNWYTDLMFFHFTFKVCVSHQQDEATTVELWKARWLLKSTLIIKLSYQVVQLTWYDKQIQ